MNSVINRLMMLGWLVFAASLPLFGVWFFRLDVSIYHFTPAAFFTLLIALLALTQGRGYLLERWQVLMHHRAIVVLVVVVVATQGLAVLRSDYLQYGVKEFLKIGLAAANFIIILALFPDSKKFLKQFLHVALISSAVLFAILIVAYGFVFKAAYLGTTPMFDTMIGKNHLAWFAAVIQPYASLLFLAPELGGLWALINVSLGVGVAYTMSRSAWLATLAFAGYFVCKTARQWQYLNRKALIVFGCGSVIGIMILFAAVPALRDDMTVRVQSIYAPQALPETPQTYRLGKHSYANRTNILQLAIKGFLAEPLVGHGLSDAQHFAIGIDQSAHNDYVNVLFETGLMGALPYFLFLCFLAYELFRKRGQQDDLALSVAARGSFLMILLLSIFIDIYTSVQYWVFLALALKTIELGARTDVT